MQQQLALCHTTPALGLMEAAELLASALGVALVAVAGFAPRDPDESFDGARSHPVTSHRAVLLTCYGLGAPIVERQPIMAGMEWSHTQLLQHAASSPSGTDRDDGDVAILFSRHPSSPVGSVTAQILRHAYGPRRGPCGPSVGAH
jgi:hypothetical protein